MKIGPLSIGWARKDAGLSINTIISRLEAAYETFSGVPVTPENCMMSPTVNAIVTAISRRISVLPVKVMKTTTSDNRTRKEELPSHPVAKLLNKPNGWQDKTTFWLDATSNIVRYGNCYFYKSRGSTGPILQLLPLASGAVDVRQDENWNVSYRAKLAGGAEREFTIDEVFHARGPARNGIKGDSPVMDMREAIALEITAERMGASVFGNSAMPSLVFKHGATSRGFETEEEEKAFIEDFQKVYANKGRFKAMVVPYGMDLDTVAVEAEKAQFLATRQYQRTVIAGAFGVPPHMVGDLSRGTFNNVEQQSLDFIVAVVLPYVKIFESAMERCLLTDEDRRNGVIIRFNIDAALRGDFKSRQEGLKIQREMGVINPNDWREAENMNPISEEDGGEDYWTKGPSGQGQDAPTDPSATTDQPDDNQDGSGGANDRNDA
jgi:HK97 family phage portal protein